MDESGFTWNYSSGGIVDKLASVLTSTDIENPFDTSYYGLFFIIADADLKIAVINFIAAQKCAYEQMRPFSPIRVVPSTACPGLRPRISDKPRRTFPRFP